MIRSLALALLACSDPNPKADDSGDGSLAEETGTGADTSHRDTGDTEVEDGPYYDCGEAPASAIVVDLTSYYDTNQFYNNTHVSGNSWGWFLTANGANSISETCDPEETLAAYSAGTPGAYAVSVSITMPAAYPPDYLGEYVNPSRALGSQPGASISIYYHDEEGMLRISRAGIDDADTSVLCLSRVRADRVSGTFNYVADPSTGLPQDFFVKFDFQVDGDFTEEEWWNGDWNDGTCMLEPFYDFYDNPEDVWDEAYWDSLEEASGDTAGR
jgi:hypothetical protein